MGYPDDLGIVEPSQTTCIGAADCPEHQHADCVNRACYVADASKPCTQQVHAAMKRDGWANCVRCKADLTYTRQVGHCYVFMRDDHDWHSCEVAVLSIDGDTYKVARASDVCEGLLSKQGSPKRKLQTWTCTHEELW